jgi:hypothetical protein
MGQKVGATMFKEVCRRNPYPVIGQFANPGDFWVHAHSWKVRFSSAYREQVAA